MGGRRVDFSQLELDLAGVSDFHRAIYDAARRIGWGETVTYGELAEQVGSPGAARAVGQAMGRNPIPVIIPCHRVLASGRKIGGFSAPGGAVTKTRLLALEGVHLDKGTPLLPGPAAGGALTLRHAPPQRQPLARPGAPHRPCRAGLRLPAQRGTRRASATCAA